MSASACDLCDQPAVIHETLSRSSVVKVRHLCRAHGLGLWRAAAEPAIKQAARRPTKTSVKTVASTVSAGLRRNRTDR